MARSATLLGRFSNALCLLCRQLELSTQDGICNWDSKMDPARVVIVLVGILLLNYTSQSDGLKPGEVSIVAGGGIRKPHEGDKNDCVDTAASMDGFFLDARFNYPWGIVFDKSDNSLYVADCGCPDSPHSNDRIRRISMSSGMVTTVAGSAQGYKDGVGPNAHFHHTSGMAVDEDSAMLYVCDSANSAIRQVNIITGEAKTFAGNPEPGFQDGKGLDVRFTRPQGLYLDAKQDRMFIADTDNHLIRVMSMPDAEVKTIAGAPEKGLVNGRGRAARFHHPTQLAYDPYTDILYVTDHYNHVIRTINLQRGYEVGVLAGSSKGEPGYKDGHGTAARFNYPEGIVFDTTHRVLYVVEFNNNCVRMVTPAGIVKTLAGGPEAGYKDGSGRQAQFFHPTGLTMDPTNKIIYVTDQYNHLVRSITAVGHNYDGPAEMVYLEQNRPERQPQVSHWKDNTATVMLVGVVVFCVLVAARVVSRRFCVRGRFNRQLKSTTEDHGT